MADTGATGRERDGRVDAVPVSAPPCCGLPSPLASAIRTTVRAPVHDAASRPAASPTVPSGEDGGGPPSA